MGLALTRLFAGFYPARGSLAPPALSLVSPAWRHRERPRSGRVAIHDPSPVGLVQRTCRRLDCHADFVGSQ